MKNLSHTLKSTLLAISCMAGLASFAQDKPEKVSFCFDDRFIANEEIDLTNIDSISFEKTSMKRFKHMENGSTLKLSKTYRTDGTYIFGDGPRSIIKPGQYSNVDFTK